MKAFFKALVLVPVALVIVLFSVANRGPVRVSLDPFSRDLPMLSYEVPLFLVVLAAIAVFTFVFFPARLERQAMRAIWS